VQHLSQINIVRQPHIGESLIEARNGTAVHFVVFPVSAVHLYDGRLVTIRIGIHSRTAERLSPVRGKPLDMIGSEAVAERMGDDLIGHHPAMPCLGKTPYSVVTSNCLENGLHKLGRRFGDELNRSSFGRPSSQLTNVSPPGMNVGNLVSLRGIGGASQKTS
jgi:hypothetical protein